MGRGSTRSKLVLTPNEIAQPDQLRRSRTASQRDVQRAKVLWLYYAGENIATIMKAVGMTRKSVSKWINKALTMGVSAGLRDTPHGSKPILTEEAKAWVVHTACSKPKDFGYAAEVWSRQACAAYPQKCKGARASVFDEGFQSDRAADSCRSTAATAQGDLLLAAARSSF